MFNTPEYISKRELSIHLKIVSSKSIIYFDTIRCLYKQCLGYMAINLKTTLRLSICWEKQAASTEQCVKQNPFRYYNSSVAVYITIGTYILLSHDSVTVVY